MQKNVRRGRERGRETQQLADERLSDRDSTVPLTSLTFFRLRCPKGQLMNHRTLL